MDSPETKEEETQEEETNWIKVGEVFNKIIEHVVAKRNAREEAMDKLRKALEEVEWKLYLRISFLISKARILFLRVLPRPRWDATGRSWSTG